MQLLASAEQADDPRYITALARGLQVLACFDRETVSLTHLQLCQKTGLPKATISRLLFTLLATGYLTQASKNTYQVGINALKLGYAATTLYDLTSVTADALKDFAIKHHVSVNIATYDKGEMRYVACYRSPARLAVNFQVGSHVPIATTAIGRAYFASSDSDTQHAILQTLKQQADSTAYPTILQQLTTANQYYQKHHYAISDGEFMPEILAIAVGLPPLDKGKNSPIPHYSLNVSVPSSQWQANMLIDTVLADLHTLADDISQRIAVL